MVLIENPKRQVHRKRYPVSGEQFVYLVRLKNLDDTLYSAPYWQLSLEVTNSDRAKTLYPMTELVLPGQTRKAWQKVFSGDWTRRKDGYTLQFRVERKFVETGECYYDLVELVMPRELVAANSIVSTDILEITINPVSEVVEVVVGTVVLPLYEAQGMPVAYEHTFANVTSLTILATQHLRPTVSSVLVLDQSGQQIWTDVFVDPATRTVQIASENAISGTLLIL